MHVMTHIHSVEVPWTKDRPVAETSTELHTSFTTDKHPCLRCRSNPQFLQESGRRPTLLTAQPLDTPSASLLSSIHTSCTAQLLSSIHKYCTVQLLSSIHTYSTVQLLSSIHTYALKPRSHVHNFSGSHNGENSRLIFWTENRCTLHIDDCFIGNCSLHLQDFGEWSKDVTCNLSL